MPYKLGSLFDGSGGFPLSGSLCGIEPKWAAEVEPYPIAVTRTRFPNMRHLGDISKVNGADIEPVDIITFGSPCQDLSVAGKRAGLKHEANGDDETTRSGLFMEAVRIIKEMREATNGVYPRYALWENVPGAFSSNKGEDFRIVCEELIKVVEPTASMPSVPQKGWAYADSYVGDGWSLAYRVFDAQYWGVPQRRRRIHLVFDFRGTSAREVLFEREGVRGYFETGRTPWQADPAYAQNCPGADDREGEGADGFGGERGRLDAVGCDLYNLAISGDKTVCLTASTGTSCTHSGPTVAYTLKIRSGCEGGGKGALVQTDKSATLATNNDQYLFAPVIDANILDDQGGQQVNVRTDGKAPTLRAEMHGNIPSVLEPITLEPGIAAREGGHIYEGVSGTIRANAGDNKMAVVYEWHSQALRAKEIKDNVAPTVPAAMGLGGPNMTTPMLVQQPFTSSASLASGKDTVGTLMVNAGTKLWLGNQEAFSGDYHIIEGQPVHYIVRRLTPTECARLQGFADRWGDIEKKDSFTPDEYEFWHGVRNTHAAINSKKVQEYTEQQMLTWYNRLQSDANEYKMWGNGIALPPALYCMQGIVDALNKEEDDDAWLS